MSAPVIPGLMLDERGKVDPCLHNATAIILHAWERADALRYDTFSGRMMLGAEQLEEAAELEVTRWLQRAYCTRFALGTVQHALRAVGFQRPFDALAEHVRAVAWDGVPRIHDMAPRILRTADTPYTREVGRVLLLSMAARALRPACKVDTIPVIEGGQGAGKSTALRILGGPFFAELLAQPGTKEAAEQMEGSWVIEIPELQSFSRAEVTAIKAFASLASDRFRRAYARVVTDVPRRSVMAGTTNADAYLRDETGARRFLVLRVGEVDLQTLRAERDQLIAEAVARVDAGEGWEVATELRAAAAEEAADRFEVDAWEGNLRIFTASRHRVTLADCMTHLQIEVAHRHAGHTKRIAQTLVTLGFVRKRVQVGGMREWAYVREIRSEATGCPASEVGQSGEVGQKKTNDSLYLSHCPTSPTIPLIESYARARRGPPGEGWFPGTEWDSGTLGGDDGDENDADLSGPWDANGGEQ